MRTLDSFVKRVLNSLHRLLYHFCYSSLSLANSEAGGHIFSRIARFFGHFDTPRFVEFQWKLLLLMLPPLVKDSTLTFSLRIV